MDEYIIDEILSLPTLNHLPPDEAVDMLGSLYETGREEKDEAIIDKALEFAQSLDITGYSALQLGIYHFYTSNGWSYLYQIRFPQFSEASWGFQAIELENEIIHLRKAIPYLVTVPDNIVLRQVYTNLANILNQLGRTTEAVELWTNVLKRYPDYGMTTGNLGYGLAHYGKIIFDPGHQLIFFQYAYKYLLHAIQSPDVYSEAKNAFKFWINKLEERFGIKLLMDIQNLTEFSLGDTPQEVVYRKWCMANALFINPLNDFLRENIVSHDCFHLPTMRTPIEASPIHYTLFNQIKQEFVTARYLYFEGLNTNAPHFSDRDNLQLDLLDYAKYSLSIEKLKLAFRMCYSLFDKIGYVVNSYWGMGHTFGKVSFRKVWEDPTNARRLNPVMTNIQNWPLRGLYWLSKDLLEKGTDYSEALLPDAKQISTIRNYVEHKSFKIVAIGAEGISEDGFTYTIPEYSFEEKIMTLVKMARSAIMYLSFAIHIEEERRMNETPTIPSLIRVISDEEKI